MTLPFLSHGGTALLVSSFAMGVVLGAARRAVAHAPERESATDKNTGPDRSGSATTSTTTVAST
jgi:hypothetical protein